MIGYIKRSFGYGVVIEDQAFRKIAEIALGKQLMGEIEKMFKFGHTDRRGRIQCDMLVSEKGIRVEIMPKDIPFDVDGSKLTDKNIDLVKDIDTDFAITVKKGKGRPKGALNKKTILKMSVNNENIS